jgi:hypothetical protein
VKKGMNEFDYWSARELFGKYYKSSEIFMGKKPTSFFLNVLITLYFFAYKKETNRLQVTQTEVKNLFFEG